MEKWRKASAASAVAVLAGQTPLTGLALVQIRKSALVKVRFFFSFTLKKKDFVPLGRRRLAVRKREKVIRAAVATSKRIVRVQERERKEFDRSVI